METFTWIVHVGTGVETRFSVLTAQFGNGYKQTTPEGLNNAVDTWNISMTGLKTELLPAYNFIKNHKGAVSFEWVTPLGDTVWVRALDPAMMSLGGDAYRMTATFEQSFQP